MLHDSPHHIALSERGKSVRGWDSGQKTGFAGLWCMMGALSVLQVASKADADD